MMINSRTATSTRRRPVSTSRPKKSVVGNVILSAALVVVAFVAMQNFRVLSVLRNESLVTSATVQLVVGEQQSLNTAIQQQETVVSLDDDSIHTFVVWTYPGSPKDLIETELKPNELLLCSYPPCGPFPSHRINLSDLTLNTPFHDFIQNHTMMKLSQKKDYLHHVQSVAVLSLIHKYSNKCARTWGDDSNTLCHKDLLFSFASYHPTNASKPAIVTSSEMTEVKFHVLAYDSRIKLLKEANMEDELQSLAAAQFYPFVTSFVDRDKGLDKVDGHLLANARFRTAFFTPSSLTHIWDTIFPSIQLRYDAQSTVNDKVWLYRGYNDKTGAIGAEDLATLEYLKQLDIKSYLALSFTIMLGRQVSPRRNKIVMVDVKSGLVPSAVEKNAVQLQRILQEPNRWKRLQYAQHILHTFATQARVVITSRIQMAMPAVAMGIPVIYVGMKDYLKGAGVGEDMFHVFDPHNGDVWNYTLDSDKELPIPYGVHRMDRVRASFWNVLRKSSSYYSNTALLYGLVPFQRLGQSIPDPEPLYNLFHFIVTTPSITWRERRAMEHVFCFHPNARVIVHSNTLQQRDLEVFSQVGYNLTVQPYDLANMLRETVSDTTMVDSFLSGLDEFQKGEYWYSHETDILRYMLLWQHGGVYLDTDMHLVRPLPTDKFHNVVAYQDPQHQYVSGGIMIFEEKHALLQAALQWTLQHYASHRNEWPILGSTLMTKLSNDYKDSVRVLDDVVFYPIDWESIDTCFTQELPDLQVSETYAVHLNTKITFHYTETTEGTFCDKLLHSNCIFCDEIHTVKKVESFPQVQDELYNVHGFDHGFDGFDNGFEGFHHDLALSFEQDSNEQEKSNAPGFLSRLASSVFGKKRTFDTVPVQHRKVLPPVHMEFVKRNE